MTHGDMHLPAQQSQPWPLGEARKHRTRTSSEPGGQGPRSPGPRWATRAKVFSGPRFRCVSNVEVAGLSSLPPAQSSLVPITLCRAQNPPDEHRLPSSPACAATRGLQQAEGSVSISLWCASPCPAPRGHQSTEAGSGSLPPGRPSKQAQYHSLASRRSRRQDTHPRRPERQHGRAHRINH